MKSPSSVRLFVFLARGAPVGVVLRRGPSKQVLAVRWDMERDRFYPGQWFKGRIYERRCDLSPSGEQFVYFAAKYKGPFQTWTAISRPPYFTALSLWPKGDAWGGGGLFDAERVLRLNHRSNQMALAPDFWIPRRFKVLPLGEHSGWGEDSPIYDIRRARDSWVHLQKRGTKEHELGARVWLEFNPREIWMRPRPGSRRALTLVEITKGIHERNGPWYITEYLLRDEKKSEEMSLGRADWADWSSKGDLLFARGGKLFSLRIPGGSSPIELSDRREVADFTTLTFSERAAPDEARSWDAPLVLKSALPSGGRSDKHR